MCHACFRAENQVASVSSLFLHWPLSSTAPSLVSAKERSNIVAAPHCEQLASEQSHACQDPEAEGEGDPMDEDTAEILEQQTRPSDKPRITTRYMTKYERARILGTRALQIR